MAIDSASKRASVLGVAIVSTLLIIPSGTIAQPERQTIAHCYSGILAGTPVIGSDDCILSLTSGMNGTVGVISGMVDPAAPVASNSVGVISGMTATGVGVTSPLIDEDVGVISGLNDTVGVESGFCDNVEPS